MGISRCLVEGEVTFELNLERLWFIRHMRTGKGVLGEGNCLGKGTEVKGGLGGRESPGQHCKASLWVSVGLGCMFRA